MNSIFQQLYMIPLWRKAIIEIQAKEFSEEENILKPLKVHFYLFRLIFFIGNIYKSLFVR